MESYTKRYLQAIIYPNSMDLTESMAEEVRFLDSRRVNAWAKVKYPYMPPQDGAPSATPILENRL